MKKNNRNRNKGQSVRPSTQSNVAPIRKNDFSHVHSISMSAYEEVEHHETQSATGGWINYGADNLFPQYIVNLFSTSAVHSALVRSIATMVAGEGLEANSTEAKLELVKIGLLQQIPHMAFDLKLQGGFYLEVKRDGNAVVNNTRHIPFQEIRIGEKDINGNILQFYHSLDWSDASCKVTPIEPFKSNGGAGSVQLFYCLPLIVGSNTYPHPDYIAAVNWIEVDKNTAVFHNNNLANGLSPGLLVNWKNGIPNTQKQQEIKEEMETNLGGPRNAGKIIMTFSDDDVSAPDITPVPLSDASDQFQFLSEESTNEIMIGHRVVSPAMFGVKTSGSLGDRQELETAAQLFHHNVIAPMQKFIVESCKTILASNGVVGNLHIHNSNPLLVEQAATDTSQDLISVVTDLIIKVNSGELQKVQAVLLMTGSLGYTQEDAEALFPDSKIINEEPQD